MITDWIILNLLDNYLIIIAMTIIITALLLIKLKLKYDLKEKEEIEKRELIEELKKEIRNEINKK